MARVDPDDDSICRWVVQHHRYDPQRREYRNVVVAAYDNRAEFEAHIAALSPDVHSKLDIGDRSPRESVSGVYWHPGYRDEHDRAHRVRRAVEHGIDPRPLLRDGKLPTSVAVFGVDDFGKPFAYGGGNPPRPPLSTLLRRLVRRICCKR